MDFSFKIDKPSNMADVLKNLKTLIESESGVHWGNEDKGIIAVGGVEGVYEAFADYILITIVKKPVLVPNKLIEKEIRKYFKNIKG